MPIAEKGGVPDIGYAACVALATATNPGQACQLRERLVSLVRTDTNGTTLNVPLPDIFAGLIAVCFMTSELLRLPVKHVGDVWCFICSFDKEYSFAIYFVHITGQPICLRQAKSGTLKTNSITDLN